MNNKNENEANVHKALSPDNSVEKAIQKNFCFIIYTLWLSIIPLTTLYDEYIDRQKLTEQKIYIVPPPLLTFIPKYSEHLYLNTCAHLIVGSNRKDFFVKTFVSVEAIQFSFGNF